MKKIALFIVASSFALAVNAQDSKTKTAATTPDSPAGTATATQVAAQSNANPKDLKDHMCTKACKDNNGVHVYVHGEKGHTCTDACKRTPAPAPAPKK